MKKYKVFIVEDDRQLADLERMNFPTDRFDAQVFYKGSDVLDRLPKERPDIIILDVVMPGMTGWDVLLKLKSDPKNSSIPIIMCTGKDSLGDVEKSFHYGAQAYVIKPVVFSKLLRKVAAILDIEELLHG